METFFALRLKTFATVIASALLAGALLSVPAAAQFPPSGAVADPDNPSRAVWKHGSIEDYWYYDCAKKKWAWVGRAWLRNAETNMAKYPSPPTKLVPSGPPPGAEMGSDGKTAFNPTTGQNFAYERDQHAWIDVKTGAAVAEPELCPPCPPTETINRRECPPTGGGTGPKFDFGIGIGGGGYHHEHRDEKSQRDHNKYEREEKSSTGKDCKAKVKDCLQACQASNGAISRKCVDSGGSPTAGLCTANEDECTCTQTSPECKR